MGKTMQKKAKISRNSYNFRWSFGGYCWDKSWRLGAAIIFAGVFWAVSPRTQYIIGTHDRIPVHACGENTFCSESSHLSRESKVCLLVPKDAIIPFFPPPTPSTDPPIELPPTYRMRMDIHWDDGKHSFVKNNWEGSSYGDLVKYLASLGSKTLCSDLGTDNVWMNLPLSPGIGSGSLIGSQYILTAKHVMLDLNGSPIEMVAVFDFMDQTKDKIVTYGEDFPYLEFESSSVYFAEGMVNLAEGQWVSKRPPENPDIAVVKLKRCVVDRLGTLRDPLKWIEREKLQTDLNGAQLFAIGHPQGLPMVFTFSGSVTGMALSNPQEVLTTLDLFHGNSGCPIFAKGVTGVSNDEIVAIAVGMYPWIAPDPSVDINSTDFTIASDCFGFRIDAMMTMNTRSQVNGLWGLKNSDFALEIFRPDNCPAIVIKSKTGPVIKNPVIPKDRQLVAVPIADECIAYRVTPTDSPTPLYSLATPVLSGQAYVFVKPNHAVHFFLLKGVYWGKVIV